MVVAYNLEAGRRNLFSAWLFMLTGTRFTRWIGISHRSMRKIIFIHAAIGCSGNHEPFCLFADSTRVGTSASNQRKRTHDNAQGRSTAAEGPSLRRVWCPTAATRNRRRPTVLCGGGEGRSLANMILLASHNFLNHQICDDSSFRDLDPMVVLTELYHIRRNRPRSMMHLSLSLDEVVWSVKDNKIDLLVQQYEQFTILEEESNDSGFARFNTIITSHKALDEGKRERIKSIALKDKKESSDDETSTSGSDDEEYDMVVRDFKKFFRRNGRFVRQPRKENKSFRKGDDKKGKSDRKCVRYDDPNHLIGECLKPPRNKDQKSFIGGSWSDSENEDEDKTNEETCLMAQSSNDVTLDSCYFSDNASSLDYDAMQIDGLVKFAIYVTILDRGYLQTPLTSNSKFTRNKYSTRNPPKGFDSFATNPDAVDRSNLLKASSESVIVTASQVVVTWSLFTSDGVAANSDVVFAH
uniref:Alpha/beta hydrolases superfamily protein n=1 Tax=Tanacetum cinerariifolium TaxID=118510 RepID=A0A6L2J8R5_TANCI|nr:hypothetical protein [Tanacetum cinerariifolium]